jgi:hypothetical protein
MTQKDKVKVNKKIKVLNVNKLKIFLQDTDTDIDKMLQDQNFNEFSSENPLTCAHAKLINYKNAAQLALIMLNEEDGLNDIEVEVDSLCDRPCTSCNSEAEYFKLNPPKQNFTQKCQNCESFKKLFLKLKEREEQCYQLRQQINFAHQHRLHQKINQIKSVDIKLKTGIAESLSDPLM